MGQLCYLSPRITPNHSDGLGTLGGLPCSDATIANALGVPPFRHPFSTLDALSGLGPSRSSTRIVSASAGTSTLQHLSDVETSSSEDVEPPEAKVNVILRRVLVTPAPSKS